MGIFDMIASALRIAATWFAGYGNEKNTKARIENDKTKKKDSFNAAISKNDIEEERKRLS